MKGAIASVEIFVFEGALPEAAAPQAADRRGEAAGSAPGSRPRRLSLVIGAPERSPGGAAWQCRVSLADLHRSQACAGRDSVEALFLAVERAKAWLAELEAEGCVLARDRAGTEPFPRPLLP